MKNNIVRKTGIRLMGIAAAMCSTFSFNPIGISYFAAVYMENEEKIWIFPIVFLTLAFTMPFLSALKYITIMIVYAIIYSLVEARRKVCGKYIGSSIAGICAFVIQAGGSLMTNESAKGILTGFLEGILVFALTAILNTGVHAILDKRGYEVFNNEEMISLGVLFGVLLYALKGTEVFTISIAPICMYLGILYAAYRYGVGMGAVVGTACGVVMMLWRGSTTSLGLMCLVGVMAGSFRSLGKLGCSIGYLAGIWLLGKFYDPYLLDIVNLGGVLFGTILFLIMPKQMIMEIEKRMKSINGNEGMEEKKGYILEVADSFRSLSKSIGKFHKQNDLSFAAAVQFNETAHLLENITEYVPQDWKHRREKTDKIYYALRKARLNVRSVHIIEQQNGREKIRIVAKTGNGRIMTVKEASAYVGRGYGKQVRSVSDGKTIINGEYAEYNFIEEPNFMVLTGVSGITKSGESISGDNFTCMELEEGQVLMGIVDGMGSGEEASEDSERVIGLLEDLLKAGYEEEAALKLVNSVLLGKDNGEASTAIDIGLMNLYSGKCSFYKSGAAATFIKRNQWVEVMKSTSMPVGVLQEVDYEAAYKKLYHGDYVIMVSDGVLETFEGEDKEEEISRFLMEIKEKNPKEMADSILEVACDRAENGIKDDMTVIVTGIWRK